MGGASSFLSLLRLTGFLGCAWLATKVSRLIGVSSIVLEISIGIVLGPNVAGLVPTDYAICRAREISCAAPPDLLFLVQNNAHIEDGLGIVYQRGLCPKEDYAFQFDHEAEPMEQVLANANGAEANFEGPGAAISGHRRLSGGASLSTIEECLVKSCQHMVSHECLLSPAFLTIVGHAGVALMIFESGMHFDFGRAGRVAPRSCIVAILGAALPLFAGAWVTMAFGKPFVPDGLAVGTALSPTSIGIALRLLAEAGALQEDFGQATITAAFLDDIISLILLNILFNLDGDFDAWGVVGKPLIGITLLTLAMVAAVKVWPKVINDWILPRVPETNSKIKRKDEVLFMIMFSVLVLYAAITYYLGTHLWGCFTAGMSFTCLGKDHHAHHIWVRQTKRATSWMIRIFFAAAVAFSIPIHALFSIDAFWKGTVMGFGPCIAAKFLCAPHMGDARFVIGAAMVGRAEFAYLIAQMAVSADMLDAETYSILIWALLYATIFAPLMFRALLTRYMAKRHSGAEDGTDIVPGNKVAARGADACADGCVAARELKAVADACAGSAEHGDESKANFDDAEGVVAVKVKEDADASGACALWFLGCRGPGVSFELRSDPCGGCSAQEINVVVDAEVCGLAVPRRVNDAAEADVVLSL